MKDKIFRISVCPICPDCGTREALESIGVDTAEQDKIIDTIHRCQRGHNR